MFVFYLLLKYYCYIYCCGPKALFKSHTNTFYRFPTTISLQVYEVCLSSTYRLCLDSVEFKTAWQYPSHTVIAFNDSDIRVTGPSYWGPQIALSAAKVMQCWVGGSPQVQRPLLGPNESSLLQNESPAQPEHERVWIT